MAEKIYKKIVCFGDSNTHGYNSKTMGRFSEEERWTCLLNKYLGEEYIVAEEGLEGRTACFEDPLFEGLCGFNYIYPCIMTHKPIDLLIIMLGTNDVKERFSSTPENVAKGIERLCQKAKDTPIAFRNKPNILLITPPPIEPGYETTEVYGEMGRSCVEKSRALAPLYEAVAKRLEIHYLDAGRIPGVDMYPYDYMHLSLDAHDNFAKELARIIPGLI
ncbi:MAG: lipolytic enzyme, G-D-S-L [Lachnospiraceae bacterium]|nr:lipolytic enzyme, G-D-S-L [Lachnospiraceae bacterium]